jgi:elongation factor Ts
MEREIALIVDENAATGVRTSWCGNSENFCEEARSFDPTMAHSPLFEPQNLTFSLADDSMMMFAFRQTAAPCARRLASVYTRRQNVVSLRSFAAVSMQLIKDLRSQSGAPISECKKALEATSDGSIEEAMDWLRQHGAAKASAKAQGREAAEGLVGLRVAGDGSAAAIIRISSETDFASRSAAFVNLVTHAVDATLAQTNVQGIVEQDVLLSSEYNGKSVKDALDEAVVAIRENLGVSSAMRLGSDQGRFVGYVHGRVEGSPVVGTAASVVHVVGKNKSDVPDEVLKDAGKKLAMHVVAAKPQYLTPDDVPEDVIAKEKDILMQQV